jgi:phosphoribosylamine--glycine ligase
VFLAGAHDSLMRHAGTNAGPDGTILANCGRVPNVGAMAPTVKETRAHACRAIDPIDWPEGSMSLKS